MAPLSVVCRLAIAGVLRILNEKRVCNSCFIYGGKQNYFVNLRNGLGQSTYDQIITYFLGQSSVYTDSMNLSEWHIYGSSRLGIYQTSINMAYRNIRIVNGVTTQETNTTVTLPSYTLFSVERGSKRYELTNHLGNVLAVVTDKKIQVCTSTAISYYTADLVSATDYSPFGAPLAGRSYTAPNTNYRFGFQRQEKDLELWGGAISYKYRIEDARLGRFFSVDPMSIRYPYNSPYAFSENRVIDGLELEGLEVVVLGGGYSFNAVWGKSIEKGIIVAPNGIYGYTSTATSYATNIGASTYVSVTYFGNMPTAQDASGVGYSFGIGINLTPGFIGPAGAANAAISGDYTGANYQFSFGAGLSPVAVQGSKSFTSIFPLSQMAKNVTQQLLKQASNILKEKIGYLESSINTLSNRNKELLNDNMSLRKKLDKTTGEFNKINIQNEIDRNNEELGNNYKNLAEKKIEVDVLKKESDQIDKEIK
jgi:hypothetical protein